MFGRYEIVIFKEGKSGSRNARLGGGLIAFVILVVVALVASNVWLWDQWFKDRGLETNLSEARRLIDDQKRQTANLVESVTTLSRDLDRVRRFDSKLRLMLNMEKDPAETDPLDFSKTYLPLHRQELATRKMQDFLDKLTESTRLEEVRQQDLLRALRGNRATIASIPSIWPVAGFVTSNFGGRRSPFGGQGQFHKGLDIASQVGTPIIAPADGTVTLAAPDGAYGNSVEVDHGGGIVTKFAHMQRFVVRQGQWVNRGDTLGYVGMTGRTTGPHLHYEVRLNGVPVNPLRYVLE